MRKSLTLLLVACAMATPLGTAFAAPEKGEYGFYPRPFRAPMNSWYDSAKWKDGEGSFVGTTDSTPAQTRPWKKPMNSWYDSPRWKDGEGTYAGTVDIGIQTRPWKKPMNSWYDSPRWKDK